MENKKMIKVLIKNTTKNVDREVVGNRVDEMITKNGQAPVPVQTGMTGGRIAGYNMGGRPITFQHLQKKGDGAKSRDIYKNSNFSWREV